MHLCLTLFKLALACGLVPPAARTPTDGAVLPDTVGAIEEITLHYDHDLEPDLTPLYLDLFSALSPDVHVRVLCQNSAEMNHFFDTWSGLIGSMGDSLAVINVDAPLTVWARDRLISRQSADLQQVMPSFVPVAYDEYEYTKLNELDVNTMLAGFDMSPPLMDAPLFVEGGNVVSNEFYTFVGTNISTDNVGCTDVRSTFEAIAGRQVIVVRDTQGAVPWCHVDMYLTPISNTWIIVADTRLGDDLLRRDARWSPQDDPIEGVSTTIDDQLDDVAAAMRAFGFSVLRMPALVNPVEEWMVTYNNVLMEVVDGRRRILIPQYGIARLDDFAAATYRSLGFEVATVDVSGIFTLGGALRCVANVTRRRPS